MANANWQWLLRWRWEAALAVCVLVAVGVFALSEMSRIRLTDSLRRCDPLHVGDGAAGRLRRRA
jgi:hypothetical protein